MFAFLFSEEKKVRAHASNWLEVATRVYHFRRDLLSELQLKKLNGARDDLKQKLKEKAAIATLKASVEKLEAVLRETGGRQYPVTSLVENVEFFLVAAIVILGLRAYFVQPFKIPTNSMWPTYNGMTQETFKPGEAPGAAARVGRLLAYGATRRTILAPADGELLVPFWSNGFVAYNERSGKTMLLFPTVNREYVFRVDNQDATLQVPQDFSGLDEVLEETMGDGKGSWKAGLQERFLKLGQSSPETVQNLEDGGRQFPGSAIWVPTGRIVHKGEPIATFDILTGDLLFVERVSYNFVQPDVGQAFVFKTENIHSVHMLKGNEQIRSYYVKRLVGKPGDTLEVQPPVLIRNGKPIEGAAAFQKNALREGKYPGYTFMMSARRDGGETLTGPGEKVSIPDHKYYAMGDNSPISADSRFWGFVPDKDVVGRPLFIYYPLSSRWGPAR
ncbi:MAG TPA: signal peptidase I [Candidatus Didemnitutus sp.]|nr:signal peptidase I [Candidatus Didemnitutus sp.]